MSFLDEDYLLETEKAKKIFSSIEDLPIVDAHSHVNPQRVVKNEGWSDIWEVEGETDHYVWSLMRRRDVSEEKITGKASNKEKWEKLAQIFPMLAGNPTYEWVHLDLKRRFGIDKPISEDTGEEIWRKTSEELEKNKLRPKELLNEMNVEVLCTTDNPISELEFHKVAKKKVTGTKLLPTWRPDKGMNIGSDSWSEFVQELEERTNIETSNLNGFIDALWRTHDYFNKNGCVASDHGLEKINTKPVEKSRARKIYKRAKSGKNIDESEKRDFKAFMLKKFGEMNEESDWVTQLHIGAVRDYRKRLFEKMGSDSGGDISTQSVSYAEGLRYFLNRFDSRVDTVIYCLDPTHLPTLATICRAFPNVNLGAPWWFNDSPYGMEKYLEYIGSVDLLSNLAGMVSDSRKLVSLGSRFEMFRRCLSNIIGELVSRGQIPEKAGIDLAKYLSFERPKELFGF